MGVQILRLEGHGGERWSADALADDEWWEHVTTVRVEAEASDTEGHGSSSIVSVVAYAGDDVEGHAITLRFSTAGEAQHFRRLIAASVIVATLGLGAPGLAAAAPTAAADRAPDGWVQPTESVTEWHASGTSYRIADGEKRALPTRSAPGVSDDTPSSTDSRPRQAPL